ncbi:MAG: aminoacyl-tRNA hydrolase [Candidatus Neomarinimicrobiota bacterium]
MIAFIGLGNIGNEYAKTKHNAGFLSIDEFAIRNNLSFKPGRGSFVFSRIKSKEVVLVKPTTGMNKSGIAVREIMDYWGILSSEIVVILDDVDLPLGKIRIRPKGGDGCHRGLENIIYQTGTRELVRMRLGIAEPLKETRPSEEYVLKAFHIDNQKEVDLMIQQSADAMEYLLNNGLNQTMSKYNS